jgi:hypothetical protein
MGYKPGTTLGLVLGTLALYSSPILFLLYYAWFLR